MINFKRSTTQTKNFQSRVNLLGQGDGTEVCQFEIAKDKVIYVNPSIRPETYEFYYIVKGKLEIDKQVYSALDYFEVKHITESYGLKALEDTVFLSFSSNTGEYDNSEKFTKAITSKLEAIQSKDHYTYEHSLRVKDLAFEMGAELNLKDTDIKHLVIAAYFHDVGKITTPCEILNKPGRLSEEEYIEMKKHVSMSFEIVEDAIESCVSDILVLHHERLDGSGYPRGLKGDEIPLLGRILAVIDSFDAMTTDRIYKKGKDNETALAELLSLSHLYDETIVKALKNVINKRDS